MVYPWVFFIPGRFSVANDFCACSGRPKRIIPGFVLFCYCSLTTMFGAFVQNVHDRSHLDVFLTQ
jgi:hypothetical protein